jgi:hypothetical protein
VDSVKIKERGKTSGFALVFAASVAVTLAFWLMMPDRQII